MEKEQTKAEELWDRLEHVVVEIFPGPWDMEEELNDIEKAIAEAKSELSPLEFDMLNAVARLKFFSMGLVFPGLQQKRDPILWNRIKSDEMR